ncbi:MAG: hypothetical protein ACE5F2_01400 [Candidatus Paceibacteria bacterium]
MHRNNKFFNHLLNLFPQFSKEEVGITLDEFFSKIVGENVGIHFIHDAEGFIEKFLNDGKIEQIIEGKCPIRFRRVKDALLYS